MKNSIVCLGLLVLAMLPGVVHAQDSASYTTHSVTSNASTVNYSFAGHETSSYVSPLQIDVRLVFETVVATDPYHPGTTITIGYPPSQTVYSLTNMAFGTNVPFTLSSSLPRAQLHGMAQGVVDAQYPGQGFQEQSYTAHFISDIDYYFGGNLLAIAQTPTFSGQ